MGRFIHQDIILVTMQLMTAIMDTNLLEDIVDIVFTVVAGLEVILIV